MRVKVTKPLNLKERNRLKEHGDVWIVLPQSRLPVLKSKHYTKSEKTGYIRWWNVEQCEVINGTS
jgi:hypothetical protein